MKQAAKGIMITIDRFKGSDRAPALACYEAIEKVLNENFSDLRIRFACAMSTLKSAPTVKRLRARGK